MPGLADLHVHLKEDDAKDNAAILQLFIANGVTTILNLHGTPDHLELRERIARGQQLGPVLYTSGPFVSNTPYSPMPTPEEVERAVIEQKRAGYDFIKIHGNFSAEAYHRLSAVARREGMRVVGHAPRNLGIEIALEERQAAIAHAEEYLDAYFFYKLDPAIASADIETQKRFIAGQSAKIPAIALATARAGVSVIPTLTAYKSIGLQVDDLEAVLRRPEVKYMVPGITPWWLPERNDYARRFSRERVWMFRAQYELLEKLVKGLNEAGVRLLAGTDSLNPCIVPGFSLHDELADLVSAGLTPYEAIKTATANAAEFLGTLDHQGTVAVGKRADLILIEGDPLKEVRNTTRISGVMLGGRWLPKTELQRMLTNQASR
jgi:imidazolonepropionase-like amidohydrolase